MINMGTTRLSGRVLLVLALAALPSRAADITLTPGETCCGSTGEIVIVSIDLTNAETGPAVVGGQFFLQYDQNKLDFLSADIGGNPFTVEIYECSMTVSPPDCTQTPGLIDYAVSTDSGHLGTSSDSTMAVVRFTALTNFCLSGLVSFRQHEPPTRLSAFGGEEVPATLHDLVCDRPPDIFPDPLGEKTRFISFTSYSAQPSAVATGTAGQTAIKVTMIDLQHPIPANLPLNPPSNFTTFDTRLNGVCEGGSYPGHHCDNDADCRLCAGGSNYGRVCTSDGDCPIFPPPSGYCPVGGTCSNRVACTAAGEVNGCARWVGKPGIFLEDQDAGVGGGTYKAARLQCTPFYHDFAGEGLLHVTGAEIVPSSVYEVEVFGSTCEGNESTCAAVSAPVPMYTRRSGDVWPAYNPPVNITQPDALDVAQIVNKLKALLGAPIKAIAQLQPNLPELNANVNALDIAAVVDAVRQIRYPFSGPCVCPSAVTCGSTACTNSDVCVTAFGTGATCVKTCTSGPKIGEPCIYAYQCGSCAGGPNAGLPCASNGVCGLDNDCIVGVCGVIGTTPGFCRDRCGRCTP
jgi:hypothetical protein